MPQAPAPDVHDLGGEPNDPRLYRKIAWRLIPFLCFCYLAAYLDRINVGFAKVNLDVYKGNGLGQSTATDVLRVDVNDVVMDVNVGGVLIGGTSIGTVALDNLHIQNTRLAVYGH